MSGRLLRVPMATALLAVGAPAPAAAPALSVLAREGGELVVANAGPVAIRLQGAVTVEGLQNGRWTPYVTEMNLVRSCPLDGVAVTPPPVTVVPGATLRPPRWRGWSCSGQCSEHCRANMYWGSGPFRFRLTDAAGGVYVSNAFRMPATPTR